MLDLSEIFGGKGKFKILKVLIEENEINISALLKKTRVSYPLAIRYLSELEEKGLVRQKKFGRIRIIRLVDNRLTRPLKSFLKEWENKKEEETLGKGFG